MKHFSKILMTAVAAALMIAPLSANAQSRSEHNPAQQYSQLKKQQVQKAPAQKRWLKGQRYSNWKSAPEVRDHKSRGLKAPGKGQRWVKVDNDYLLVSIASGVIASMIAGP